MFARSGPNLEAIDRLEASVDVLNAYTGAVRTWLLGIEALANADELTDPFKADVVTEEVDALTGLLLEALKQFPILGGLDE